MNDKKAQTRERILQAASAALIQRGPAEPSVSEVMAAAGLTVGGFYAHFESKDALMLEAFKQLLSQRRAKIEEVDDQLGGEERRALIAAFYLSRKHRDAVERGCPLPAVVGEIGSLPACFREALNEHVGPGRYRPDDWRSGRCPGAGSGRAVRQNVACCQVGSALKVWSCLRLYAMNTLSWIRGINGTLGRVAPRVAASRMRQVFMTPRERLPRDWELPLLATAERITLRFGLSALRWGQADRGAGGGRLYRRGPRRPGPWPVAWA